MFATLISQLITWALKIKNQTQPEGNTETLVGGLLEQIVNLIGNVIIWVSNFALGIILKGDRGNETIIKAIINPSRGDAYRALDTGHYWVFDGAEWNDVGEFITLTQEKGQSINLAVSQKLFTDEIINIRKNFTNVSIDQDNFAFSNKAEARSSVPANNRSLGTSICYRIGERESEEYTYKPTSVSGSAVRGDTGAILTGVVNSQLCTIPVAGYEKINLQIQNNNPSTTQPLGGAFFDSSGNFISGYYFFTTQVSNGDRKDIAIPNNAVTLKHTYVSDAWATANGIAVLGYVTLTKTAIADAQWVFERFEGTDISTWLNDSSWVNVSNNASDFISINDFISVNNFKSGSQIARINQAIELGASTGKRVIIPKYDTVSNSDVWLIDSAILLPSNVYIELDNCKIKLSDICRDNHFRTKNLFVGQSVIDPLENIHVKGNGNAILEGADNPRSTGDWNKVLTTNSALGSWSSYGTDAGKSGQNQYGGWLNYSVVFCNTKNFSFSGVRFVEPHAWSMAIDNSSFGVIENIIINASGGRTINGIRQYFKNQGAIIAVQGCHDLIFRNISGNNSDDIMMIGCLLVPSTSSHASAHSTGNQNTHSPSGDVYRGAEDDTYNITIQDIMADATASGVNYALIKFTPSYLQKQYNIVVERLYSIAANKITFDYYDGTNPVIGAGKGTNKAYTLRDVKSNIRIVSNNGGQVQDSLFENIVYSGSGDPIGISKETSYNNIFENIRNITL